MNELQIEDAERVSDVSDRATAFEEAMKSEALRKALSKIEKPPAEFDGCRCIECDEPIPEARLKTGAFRDINCQQRHELKQKNHRSHYE